MISVSSHSREPYEITIIISKNLPKSSNSFLGRNPWASRGNAKSWKRIIRNAVALFVPEKPLEKASIQVVRYSSLFQDFDGLVSSLKPIIDGLTPEKRGSNKGSVLKDDSWSVTGPWVVDQIKCKRAESRLVITVREC